MQTSAIHTLTLTIAIVAVVFAVWPVVGDAPWEDERVATRDLRAIRCEGALQLRDSSVQALGNLPVVSRNPNIITSSGGVDPDQLARVDNQLEKAEREIGLYC